LVSIHAPAWGATHGFRQALGEVKSFNPRARVGRDVLTIAAPFDTNTFQSTRPRGARHNYIGVMRDPLVFQSTRPRGARLESGAAIDVVVQVSIHAPAWGATGERRNEFAL